MSNQRDKECWGIGYKNEMYEGAAQMLRVCCHHLDTLVQKDMHSPSIQKVIEHLAKGDYSAALGVLHDELIEVRSR